MVANEGALETLREFLKSEVAPHLKSWLAPLDEWLTALPPWSWKASTIGLFVLGAVFALLFRRSYIYRGAPDGALWRDLRIWAVVFLVPYVLVYLLLG